MRTLDIFVTALLIAGALLWGLIGFFGFDLLSALFGEGAAIGRVLYSLVGLAALYEVGSLTIGRKELQHRWCDVPISMRH